MGRSDPRIEDGVDDGRIEIPLERKFPGGHFIHQQPKRPDIRTVVRLLPSGLLGRHVTNRAHRDTGLGKTGNSLKFRQPEIEDLGVPVLGDHDVSRLDVPVHDAVPVGAHQAACNRQSDLEHLARGKRRFLQALGQGHPIVIGHADEWAPAIGFIHLVDAADIRVVQGRGRLGLLDEAVFEIGVGHQVGMDEFERTMDLKLGIEGLVDRTHAPVPDLFEDFIVRNSAADHHVPSDSLVIKPELTRRWYQPPL